MNDFSDDLQSLRNIVSAQEKKVNMDKWTCQTNVLLWTPEHMSKATERTNAPLKSHIHSLNVKHGLLNDKEPEGQSETT